MELYYLSSACLFNQTSRCITDENHNVVHQLTHLQFKVLDYLIINKGIILTYDKIIENVWGPNGATEKNVADVISQLRKIHPGLRECIQTQRGVGFVFKCSYNQPKRTSSNEIRVLSSREMETLGYTPTRIARELVSNDLELYGDLGENEGDANVWSEFIRAYPDTFFCALNDNDEIIGNWSFCSPQDEQLELIKKGHVKESHFNLENSNYIHFPSEQGYYDGFILNFSLNRSYRTISNEHLLFESFANQLLQWATFGIFFRTIYVNVFLEDQERFYQSLGFTELCVNQPNGTIYSLNLSNFPQNNIWGRFDELRQLYSYYFGNIFVD